MRRLPVYLLLDTSGSMSGEPIEALKTGVQTLVSALRTDPYALETAFLSIITFASLAKQVCPLTELATFQVPSAIAASGTTALGEALGLLADCIETEVAKTTSEAKGDWKPIVFIMTDGSPTDDWQKGVNRLKKVRTGVVVACAAGRAADTSVLKQLADVVVQLDTADENTIKSFFKWATASIVSGSQKVDSGQKEVTGLGDLPPPPPEVNVVL
ncbi:MAG: VWA domain-containing protein [Candidatus Accumulibacter sp.]|jgi:uncharacterized protein YegL|nr:VWA domain-containing protein [Candidatus Accumulibacter propinquus]